MNFKGMSRYAPAVVTVLLIVLGAVGGVVWYREVGHENALRHQETDGLHKEHGRVAGEQLSGTGTEDISDSISNQQFSVRQVDNGMSMYENTTLGFGFQFPTQYSAPDSCQERSVVEDRSGKEVRLEKPIQQSSSRVIDTTILSGQHTYVVAAPNTVLSKGEYRTPEGMGYPTECIAKQTTIETLEQAASQREYFFYPGHTTWFVYRDVTDSRIDDVMRQIAQRTGAHVNYRLDNAASERMAVVFSSEEAVRPADGAYGRVAGGWYYPHEKILAVMTSWRGVMSEDTIYIRVNTDQVVTVRNMLESFRVL